MPEHASRGSIFLDRALRAAGTGGAASRVWLELGIPALDGFLRVHQIGSGMDALKRLTSALGEPEPALETALDNDNRADVARAFGILGTLFRLGAALDSHPALSLEAALAEYERALALLTKEESPQQWAEIQYGLGMAEVHAGKLHPGIRQLEGALDMFEDAADRAAAQEQIDRAYRELPANDPLRIRKNYLQSVIREHRFIRFSGMAEVSGPDMVEMSRVFVLPRVRREGDEVGDGPAADLLLSDACRRAVILGGPGSGKTTLLQALALGLARGAELDWAKALPRLLPIFYRIRDLDQDLENHVNLWDCLEFRCSKAMNEPLPNGWLQAQMADGGLAVLFDGLDEAGSADCRNRIVDLIAEFSRDLSAESRLLITSRPYDYTHAFDRDVFPHYDLVEFKDSEIRTFIHGWLGIHETNPSAAQERAERLWKVLQSRKDIFSLARNALLLTMIVRVHFGLGALPDSRLGLYEKCAETLLKHWAEAAGLPPSPISFTQKHKLLERLAYEMQGEAEELSRVMSLQISRADLARRFLRYLEEEGHPDAARLVDAVIHRLHARDAILVQYGTDKRGQDLFGFVHRSFQEYFAACWMAQELDENEFREQLEADREGWNETLYLAVAQLADRRRRKTLQELLKTGRADFAINCLRAAPPEQPWLATLVRFLSRYTATGWEFHDMPVSECAEACASRPETRGVLTALIQGSNREGRSLAAAVELMEALGGYEGVLTGFFSEAKSWPDDMVRVEAGPFPFGDRGKAVDVPAFFIDRYLVTNQEFERMIKNHRRAEYSETDRQPVTNVNWYEARLYCRWRGGSLPTEEEWEKAAAWDAVNEKKRLYPWGNEFDSGLCNTDEGGVGKTTPVGAYPEGRSPYGCEDMAGNVWEWTESLWSRGEEARVVRGGSFDVDRDGAACAYRDFLSPFARNFDIGFRCSRT